MMQEGMVGTDVREGRGIKKKLKGEIQLQRIGGMLIGEFAMQYF